MGRPQCDARVRLDRYDDAGIRHFDASLGGLGGCPFAPGASGNICNEDLVHMLDAMGSATAVELERLIACARRMPGLVGHGVPVQVQHAGAWDHRFPPPADLEATRERALARELSGDAYRAMRPVVERWSTQQPGATTRAPDLYENNAVRPGR